MDNIILSTKDLSSCDKKDTFTVSNESKRNEIIHLINSREVSIEECSSLIALEHFENKKEDAKFKINVTKSGDEVLIQIVKSQNYNLAKIVPTEYRSTNKPATMWFIITFFVIFLFLIVIFNWNLLSIGTYSGAWLSCIISSCVFSFLAFVIIPLIVLIDALKKKKNPRKHKRNNQVIQNFEITKEDKTKLFEEDMKEYTVTLKHTEEQVNKIVKEKGYPDKVKKYILDKIKEIKKYN